MNNWQPSSIEEVWKESFPEEQFPNGLHKFLCCMPISIFFSLVFFVHRFPLIGIQLFLLIKHFNWLQLAGFIVTVLLTFLLYAMAIYKQAFDSIQSILRYINFDLKGKFTLEERSLEEYIGAEKIQEIRAARPVSWAKQNKYPICRIFVRHPLQAAISAEKKGFAAPVGYYSPGLPPQSISLIFLDDPPSELRYSNQFFVYHEVGHTTKQAWRIKTKPYIMIATVLPLTIWILVNTSSLLPIFFLFLYLLIRGFLELIPFRNNFEDEVIADTFAIRRLPSSFPLDNEDNHKINLERILEATCPIKNVDSGRSVFNKKRLENVRKIITMRKENRPFSVFETGRKIAVGDVLLLDILLVIIILWLKSPSIYFFAIMLLITLILFLVVSYIYLAQIIPGTNLVETSIKSLTSSSKEY